MKLTNLHWFNNIWFTLHLLFSSASILALLLVSVAPCSSNNSTNSSMEFLQTYCKGVSPSSNSKFISAPCLNNKSATSAFWSIKAWWKAVLKWARLSISKLPDRGSSNELKQENRHLYLQEKICSKLGTYRTVD